jgi:hypothetical protein
MAWHQHRNKERLVRKRKYLEFSMKHFKATVEYAKAQDGPPVQADE